MAKVKTCPGLYGALRGPGIAGSEIERFLTAVGFCVDGASNEQHHNGQRIQADWLFRLH